MNETRFGHLRKFSWALIVPHIFLIAHFNAVLLSQKEIARTGGPPPGVIVLAEIIGTSAFIECGWTMCLNGDFRQKPLTSAIVIGGVGFILLGILIGILLDKGLGCTSRPLISFLISLSSLTLGTAGVLITRNSNPQPAMRAWSSQTPPVAVNSESNAHYLAGIEFFKSRNYEKAQVEWAVAHKLDPNNKDAERGLLRLAAISATKPKFECVEESGPPPPSYLGGIIRFQKQDYVGAREYWNKALKERPNDCNTLSGLERINKLEGIR